MDENMEGIIAIVIVGMILSILGVLGAYINEFIGNVLLASGLTLLAVSVIALMVALLMTAGD